MAKLKTASKTIKKKARKKREKIDKAITQIRFEIREIPDDDLPENYIPRHVLKGVLQTLEAIRDETLTWCYK